MRQRLLLATTTLLATLPLTAHAESSYKTDNLTGDWNGSRQKLSDRGVDLQAIYTSDVFSNLSGGIDEGTRFMDNLDITAEFDGSKLYGLEGSKVYIYLLNNNGAGFNEHLVGSSDGISNIEVSDTTFKLYEAWVEQALLEDRFSIRVGLYDVNSEFDVTDASGVFLNPTFGIDTAYAATGQNGPSIFPTTSFGARVQILPTEKTYLIAAVLDGVAGDPGEADGTHIVFGDDDGLMLAFEAGYSFDGTKLGAGFWHFTEESDHLSDVDALGNPVRDNQQGIYFVAETELYKPDATSSRGLSGFARVAFANDDVSQFDYSWGAGLAYLGPIAEWEDDILGLAFHGVHNGDAFMSAQAAAGTPTDDAEWGVELTYRKKITPWFALQPDIQYVVNPGTSPDVDNAWVFGLRSEIVF